MSLQYKSGFYFIFRVAAFDVLLIFLLAQASKAKYAAIQKIKLAQSLKLKSSTFYTTYHETVKGIKLLRHPSF